MRAFVNKEVNINNIVSQTRKFDCEIFLIEEGDEYILKLSLGGFNCVVLLSTNNFDYVSYVHQFLLEITSEVPLHALYFSQQ